MVFLVLQVIEQENWPLNFFPSVFPFDLYFFWIRHIYCTSVEFIIHVDIVEPGTNRMQYLYVSCMSFILHVVAKIDHKFRENLHAENCQL